VTSWFGTGRSVPGRSGCQPREAVRAAVNVAAAAADAARPPAAPPVALPGPPAAAAVAAAGAQQQREQVPNQAPLSHPFEHNQQRMALDVWHCCSGAHLDLNIHIRLRLFCASITTLALARHGIGPTPCIPSHAPAYLCRTELHAIMPTDSVMSHLLVFLGSDMDLPLERPLLHLRDALRFPLFLYPKPLRIKITKFQHDCCAGTECRPHHCSLRAARGAEGTPPTTGSSGA
jgi:hypothetical protein